MHLDGPRHVAAFRALEPLAGTHAPVHRPRRPDPRRSHYTHCPEPQRVVATGTTRDGTFLIRDGAIAGALGNLRFTQSVLETLSNIEALSDTAELHRDLWGSAAHHVPAMRVRDFSLGGEAG